MIHAGSGGLRHRARRMMFGFLLFFLTAANPRAAASGGSGGPGGPDKEHQLKAVFLYRFAQFVDWPPDRFGGESAPLVLGILGPDPFGAYLDNVVQGEKVGAHPIVIKRIGKPEEAADCHVLFISGTDSDPEAAEVLSALKGRGVLTVGDTESFSRGGGMILFLTRNGRIRLRINMDAVHASNLSLSSKLLRLAEIAPSAKD
jgi:uncharacterized protein DUF4154